MTADIADFAETLFLELQIAYGEDLVNQQDFRFEVGGNGKCQAGTHPAGVTLDWCINESFDLRESDDLVELTMDFRLRHPENRAVEIDVLPAGEFGMKTRTDLKQRADAATNFSGTFRGIRDARKDFEQCALPRPISPDNAHYFATANLERHVL